jgi:peptidoglycan/LPS O-acetylase OafA/YrhL
MKSIEGRQNGLDLGRVIAVVVVIMIHLPDPSWTVINFAVPYFFVLSGYLLSRRAHAGSFNISILQKFVVRHWKLFGAWALLYSAIPPNWPYYALHGGWIGGFISTLEASSAKLLINPANFLLDGPPFGFHLWYLACAPLAAGVVFMLARNKLQLVAIILALVCICALLLLKPEQRLGTEYWASNAKLGFLNALPCICFGWFYASRKNDDKHLLSGSIACLIGVILALFSSSTALASIAGIVLGIGLFVVLISFPALPMSRWWSALGQMSLGVYLIHIALRPIVFFVMPKLVWAPSWVGVVLLTVLSFTGAFLLSKIPVLKSKIL